MATLASLPFHVNLKGSLVPYSTLVKRIDEHHPYSLHVCRVYLRFVFENQKTKIDLILFFLDKILLSSENVGGHIRLNDNGRAVGRASRTQF